MARALAKRRAVGADVESGGWWTCVGLEGLHRGSGQLGLRGEMWRADCCDRGSLREQDGEVLADGADQTPFGRYL